MGCKIKGHCLFWCVIVAAFVFVLMLLYQSTWFSKIRVDYGFVPVDAIGILVSAAVTVWVGLTIAKKLTENRFEKDYLISDLNKMEAIVSGMEKLYKNSTIVDLSNISAMNAELQSVVNRFIKTIELMEEDKSKYANLLHYSNMVYSKTTSVDGSFIEVENVNLPNLEKVFNDFIVEVRRQIIEINNN